MKRSPTAKKPKPTARRAASATAKKSPTKAAAKSLRTPRTKSKVHGTKAQRPQTARPKAKAQRPKTARPKTARPKTARPKTARPKTARLKTARLKTARLKTARPTGAAPRATPPKTAPQKAPKARGPKSHAVSEQRPAALLRIVEKSLDDDQAVDVASIPLAGKTTIADHMVVASGRSQRQVGAMADHLVQRLKAAGLKGIAVEGMPQNDWVLVDAGYVIVHLFRPEVRTFYNLEKMWEADFVDPDAEPDAGPDAGVEPGAEGNAGERALG